MIDHVKLMYSSKEEQQQIIKEMTLEELKELKQKIILKIIKGEMK